MQVFRPKLDRVKKWQRPELIARLLERGYRFEHLAGKPTAHLRGLYNRIAKPPHIEPQGKLRPDRHSAKMWS